MTGAALLPLGVRKEIRALLPVWLGCAAAICAAAVLDGFSAFRAAVSAYVLGSVALGALSIGHEYTSRTLTLLLSLPVDRRRLYLVKLGVLIPMVLTLGALALGLLFKPRALDPDLVRSVTIPFLSVMCGLFLAPWFTMLCRSPLAGVVFAIPIPGLIHIAGDVAGVATYGMGTPEAERLKFAVLWWGLTGLCAIAAASSWRMFMRLEAIEGDDAQVRLPRWLRDRTAAAAAPDVERARHPVWLLAKKELRLQQLTFVVSGIYLVVWGTLWLLRLTVPGFEGIPFAIFTVFHSGAAAMLSGSLASAEERQFGTLESQVLLPMATWKQWTVKAGMTLGVALLLAAGLPAFLGHFSPSGDGLRVNGWFAGTIVLLTAGSLYVSSLCASGLRALLASISVIVSVIIAVPLLLGSIFGYWSFHLIWTASRSNLPRWSTAPLAIAAGAGLLALLLRFALVNHRSSERSGTHVWRQVAWIAAWLSIGAVILIP